MGLNFSQLLPSQTQKQQIALSWLPRSIHQSLGKQECGMIKCRATESTLLPTETVKTPPGVVHSHLSPKTVQESQSCTAACYYCSEKDQAVVFINPLMRRDKNFHSCSQYMHRHF